jgi:hypothetical protein
MVGFDRKSPYSINGSMLITAYEDYLDKFKESFPMLDEAKYFIRKPKAIEDLVNHVATILG